VGINARAKALFVNRVGQLPDVSTCLDKFTHWLRFAKWCHQRGSFRVPPPTGSYMERFAYFRRILEGCTLRDTPFTFLEFGVYKGESLRWWRDHALHPNTRYVGFDTVSGLPTNWEGKQAGHFSTNGTVPQMDDTRFRFEVGLFQDTLPLFLRSFERRGRLLVHLDADLYSSTLFVLMTLGHLLQPDDLLLFDEFSSVTHEFRAFLDFLPCFQVAYDVPYRTGNFNRVCVRLLSHDYAERIA
jgi:O-methyltransferase